MSYNIDTWQTKKIKDLKIPLNAFKLSNRKDWHPEIKIMEPLILPEGIPVIMRAGEDFGGIKGFMDSDHKILTVTYIYITGEGSGGFMHYVMEEALKHSTGELEAVLIWEGGDSITRLIVKDGELTEEDIEL